MRGAVTEKISAMETAAEGVVAGNNRGGILVVITCESPIAAKAEEDGEGGEGGPTALGVCTANSVSTVSGELNFSCIRERQQIHYPFIIWVSWRTNCPKNPGQSVNQGSS